jgi:uncharacterized membrane protein YjfL (UPF0719 family)
MENFDIIYWDSSYNPILLTNLAIAIILFASIRLFSGFVSHAGNMTNRFTENNLAFGISILGMVLGVTIVLSGAIYGDPVHNMMDSVISVGLYGVTGIILMWLTRLIFDKIALPKVSLRQEIEKGNVAAGILDAGNVIATALIVRAVMVWVETNTIEGLVAVLASYVISQVLLTLVSFIRIYHYSNKIRDVSLQDAFSAGHTAVALNFAGRRIEAAFAITAASNIMVYEIYDLGQMLIAWVGVSVLMIILVNILSWIADKIILMGIDTREEVFNKRNVELGAIQGMIYVCIGLLLAELIA